MESKVDFQRRREVKRAGDEGRDQRCSASKGSDSFHPALTAFKIVVNHSTVYSCLS